MDRQNARNIISLSHDLNVDAAEVYLRSFSSTTIEVKDQQVDAFERANDVGAGLRVLVNGRTGFAFTTDFSDQALKALVESAITNAKNAEPDPFLSIPGKPDKQYETVTIYDPEIPSLQEKEKIDRVKALEREAFAVDRRVRRIRKASASFSEGSTIILNSKGAEAAFQSTACSCSIEVVAEDKGESQAGSEFDVNRFYRKLRVEEVGRKAAQRALDLLGAQRISSTKAPVILEATVAQEFLAVMASGFSAENVQKKKSLFIDKLDREIVSPLITVYDDGLLTAGLGSAPCDDEAVPMQKKRVIDSGRLTMFLYNTYTANKDKTASTGNGMRGGFKGIPGVGITNLYIDPGRCSLKGLMEQAGRGLYVTEVMGMHTANPISGDFSVGATGFWFENGERAFSVREITIAGNILELMRNIDIVGSDIRFSGRIGSPSLLVRGVSIGGK